MGLRIENGQVVDDEAIKLNVSFYEHARKVGVGKYAAVDYIKVRAPGFRDYMSRPATDDDKASYPKEWDAYQGGKQADTGETPLTMLPSFKTAFALELKLQGITCIEVLGSRGEPDADYLKPMWKEARNYIKLQEMNNEEG